MTQEHGLSLGPADLESMVSLPASQAAASKTSAACMHDISANTEHPCVNNLHMPTPIHSQHMRQKVHQTKYHSRTSLPSTRGNHSADRKNNLLKVFQRKSVLISPIKATLFMFNISACSASMQESSSEVGTPTQHGSIYTMRIPVFSTHTSIVLHNSMFLFKLSYNHIETQNIKWCLAFQRFLCNHETYSISKQKIII
jgi:hypothetical protein